MNSADSAARLESWIAEYGDAVLRMCFLYLADRALAEDAMQDTFIKAWRRMGQFEGRNDSTVKTWLVRIAINTCKDYRRSAWFRHVDRAAALEELPAQPVSAEAHAATLAVMRLPERLQRVVLLYHYQNLTMAEVAQTLRVSRVTVQKRLQRAYGLLRLGGRDLDGE